MSGRGRGTARISPLASSDPIIANLSVGANRTAIIQSVSAGKWCYTLQPQTNPQTLTGSFVDFNDGNGTSFTIPIGSCRGIAEINYTPAAANSQLEVEIRYPSLSAGVNRGVFSLPGTATFPAGGDTVGADLPIATPVFQTQVEGGVSEYTFLLPFCVPAGCPTNMAFGIREIGTSGGAFEIQSIQTDNVCSC